MAKTIGIPLINLWNWSDGNQYTIEDNNIALTPALAESDKKTDEIWDNHFEKTKSGNKAGKGRSKFKVEPSLEKGGKAKKVMQIQSTKSSKSMDSREER